MPRAARAPPALAPPSMRPAPERPPWPQWRGSGAGRHAPCRGRRAVAAAAAGAACPQRAPRVRAEWDGTRRPARDASAEWNVTSTSCLPMGAAHANPTIATRAGRTRPPPSAASPAHGQRRRRIPRRLRRPLPAALSHPRRCRVQHGPIKHVVFCYTRLKKHHIVFKLNTPYGTQFLHSCSPALRLNSPKIMLFFDREAANSDIVFYI